MVKIIAQNVDELLLRYDNRDQVSAVNIARVNTEISASKQDRTIDAIMKRLHKLETSSRRRSCQDNKYSNRSTAVCSHCTLLKLSKNRYI